MIRTKVKGLFLSITLILACFCLFACKETKVGVDEVRFDEQAISMLVGDEYSPYVKILPSYATNRSYKLISEDETVLAVEGGTIVALKPTEGVTLKAVSNDNSRCNDVIVVKIYSEPIVLDAPTGLTFDGDRINFTDLNDSNVSAYMLKIGSREINIGNNTSYSFDGLVEKLGVGLYNAEISCRVKAVGDQKIFIDSEYSEPITFTKLSSVKDVVIRDSKLYFNPVGNVVGYKVEVLKDGKLFATLIENNYKLTTGIDLSTLNDFESGAEYTLNIIPSTAENVFNSKLTSVKYIVVGQVNNLNIKDTAISWDFVKNAQTYDVEIYKGQSLVKEYKDVAYNNVHLPAEIRNSSGQYICKVIAKSSAPNTTQGNQSKEISFSVLPAPVVVAEGNNVYWNEVANA